MAKLDTEMLDNLVNGLNAIGASLDYGVHIPDCFPLAVSDGDGEYVYLIVELDEENGIYVVDL